MKVLKVLGLDVTMYYWWQCSHKSEVNLWQ